MHWIPRLGYSRLILAALCAFSATACGEQLASVDDRDRRTAESVSERLVIGNAPTGEKPMSLPYAKPGAAVSFSHNYVGGAQPGESELVTLSFVERYTFGQLKIRLQPTDGLQISPGERTYSYDLAAANSVEIELALVAEVTGKYYLNIFASVINAGVAKQSRVFALAFQVGDAVVQTRSSLNKSADGEKVILLPITERQR